MRPLGARQACSVGAAALLALALSAASESSTHKAEARDDTTFGPPMTISPPYGEHADLVTAMDEAGETKLVWSAAVGEAHSIQTAEIAPGETEAGPVETVGKAARPTSPLALAEAPSGRTAVAWFEERKTQQVDGSELLALEVRDQPSHGRWERPRIAWRPSPRAGYSYWGLNVALDPAGDELATWLNGLQSGNGPHAVALRAAWRHMGDGFAPTQTVTPPGVEARGPAVALSPSHGALIVWSEITSDGSGPVLSHATAAAGAGFTAGRPVTAMAASSWTSAAQRSARLAPTLPYSA